MKNFFITLALLACSASVHADSAWGRVSNPLAAPAQVIGFYSAGCLAGGEALPLQGQGFQVMRPSRNRYYGHPDLIAFLERLASQVATRGDRLLIGDLSQPRGGPMSYGHASHQIGLDVDIWLAQGPQGRALTPRETEDTPMVSTVIASQGRVDPNRWSPRYRDIIRLAASDPKVERIFVNPIIKKALCESNSGDRSWLRKVRPWWGHDAHFHVRLRCPAGSPNCRSQKPPPSGDGCNAGLNKWVGEIQKAALRPAKPTAPRKARKPKVLPVACQSVLRGNWAARPANNAAKPTN